MVTAGGGGGAPQGIAPRSAVVLDGELGFGTGQNVDVVEKCPRCRADLDQKDRPGRPRRYCGELCRRDAEYEIRRIQRRLEHSERQLQASRYESDVKRA